MFRIICIFFLPIYRSANFAGPDSDGTVFIWISGPGSFLRIRIHGDKNNQLKRQSLRKPWYFLDPDHIRTHQKARKRVTES
jgi:hypothetical protein